MASLEQAQSEIAGAPDSGPIVLPGRRRLGAPFWRLWSATGISGSGDGLVAVAIPLLTVTLTRNPLVIAGATAANRASAAIMALPAGLIADRVDRRRLMVACNLVAGAALSGLVVAMTLGSADLAMVYLVAVVLAACDVTYGLALQAAVPMLTSSLDQLALANGRLMAVEGAGQQFIGPGTGGFLFSLARRLPFFGDGLSFFVAALLVGSSFPRAPRRGLHARRPGLASSLELGRGDDRGAGGAGARDPGVVDVREPGPPGRYERPDVRGRHRSGWAAAFREGVRVFRRERSLKLLAATVSSVAFCQFMVIGVLVVYGTRTLHLTSTRYGLFLAFASLVGVPGALSAGVLQRRFGAGRLIVGGAFAATLSYVGLSFTRSGVLAVFVLGLQEVGVAVANVASVTARQHLVPRALLGRVSSVHRLGVAGAAPFGALVGGFIASVSSAPVTMLAAGLTMMATLALLAPALLRSLAATAGPASA